MILMPFEDPLVNHSYEISQLSPFRVETIYIYISQPNNPLLSKRIPALWQIKRQSPPCKPFSTFVSPRPGDSKLILNSSLTSSWRRRLGVVMGVIEGMFYLLEQWHEITFDLNTSSVLITNLIPGEEQEDPERRYVE
ncbi:hypothetical protein HID58_055329 [Brassica napus]|uniref:Uncharacterized protein n=1 Tax=Brassica napus TaxID=3708 RepID=A0ABQ8ALI7_BRANA|nr:hypothetical protein HID58_055329 [Brassica napus]